MLFKSFTDLSSIKSYSIFHSSFFNFIAVFKFYLIYLLLDIVFRCVPCCKANLLIPKNKQNIYYKDLIRETNPKSRPPILKFTEKDTSAKKFFGLPTKSVDI